MMKNFKFIFSFLVLIIFNYSVSAQVPDGFNYMSVARDGNGDILKEKDLGVRIAILEEDLTVVWEEEHLVTTNNDGLFQLIVGDPSATPVGTGYVDDFSDIDWTLQSYKIKTSISLETGVWLEMGTAQLLSVPYSMVSNYSYENAGNPFTMNGDTIIMMHSVDVIGNYPKEIEAALFEVKRQDGQTMFAVYNQGVRINIPLDYTGIKGVKGGFSIGGFSGTKDDPLVHDLFTLNKDSARIFMDQTPNLSKGAKGGFAIGGFGYTKQDEIQDYLFIGSDSARIYVKDELGTKGVKGGFAIGGFGAEKGSSTNFMDITSENYFIGHETGTKVLEDALYNSVLGYKAARNLTSGKYNTVIGYLADSSLTSGSNNIIIGASAGRKLTTGKHNTLIGNSAGFNHTSQEYNVMIGTTAGYNVTGSFNTFMGINAGYKIQSGTNNTFLGTNAGAMLEEGNGNTIIGIDAGRSGVWDPTTYHTGYITSDNTIIGNRAGYNLNVGNGNIFIGYEAGFNETGIVGSGTSDKLYIDNSSSDPPLIYGDFSVNQLGINTKTLGNTLNVGGDAYVSGNLSAGSITAPVTGDVTGDLTGNVSGDVTGNVTGDVTGNLTGNVNGVETGKIYLTVTDLVQSTAAGTFQLIWHIDEPGTLEIRNFNSDYPCDYWFKKTKGEEPLEDSGTVEPGGNIAYIITHINEFDGTGFEIHFGQAHSDAGFCSVWVQYFKGILAGHYIKY